MASDSGQSIVHAPYGAQAASGPSQPFGGMPAGEEIIAVVKKYYISLAASNYEDAVALMQPGMRVFTPFGKLLHLPNDAQVVIQIYKQLQAQGFRMAYTPLEIDGAVYGNVAFAAFLLHGKETAPGGASTSVERRGTQVWVKEGDQWRIAHMHVSTNDEWESWRGKLPPK